MGENSLFAQAADVVDQLEDQSVVQEGGFDFEIAPAGLTPARFCGYVDLGKRKQRPYQGKDKPDADEVRLYFELNGPKHVREVEVDGVMQKFTNMISVKVTKKQSDKASFFKLFNKMTYGRDSIKHMTNMLGEGFLIKVVHNEVEKDGKKTVYANMRDTDGTWTISAPSIEDPMSGDTTAVPVPEMTQQARMLLWNSPTAEQWASIFIDGTRTVKDEKGLETEISKNWLQEDIVQNALNFEGSALQALIGGVDDLNLDLTPDEPEAPVAPEEPKTPAPKEPDAPKAPEEPAPKADQSAAELMASLGLG